MLNGSVTQRYTEGLFQVAAQRGILEEVDGGLLRVDEALRDFPQFRALLENPVVGPDEKALVVTRAFQGVLHPVVLTFLHLLFTRKRSAYIPAVRSAFHARANEHRGRVEVHLQSARDLARAQLEQIVGDLQNATQKQIEAHVSVNPELIAGYRLQIGNRIVDASISGALGQFRAALSGRRIV